MLKLASGTHLQLMQRIVHIFTDFQPRGFPGFQILAVNYIDQSPLS